MLKDRLLSFAAGVLVMIAFTVASIQGEHNLTVRVAQHDESRCRYDWKDHLAAEHLVTKLGPYTALQTRFITKFEEERSSALAAICMNVDKAK